MPKNVEKMNKKEKKRANYRCIRGKTKKKRGKKG